MSTYPIVKSVPFVEKLDTKNINVPKGNNMIILTKFMLIAFG